MGAITGGLTAGQAILGGAAISAVGGLAASERGAGAARGAVSSQIRAQQQARAVDLALRRESRDLALKYAEATPEELAQIDALNTLNLEDIERKEKLLDSVDPALMEAGVQALALLQGEEAKTLDPIRRARAEQREQLKSRLVAQFGPGYANTSAGIRALNDFNAETDSLLAVEQDRTLGRLLGTSQNVRQFSSLTPNLAAASSIAELRGGLQRRMIGAIQATPLTTQFAPEGMSSTFAAEAVRAQGQGTAFGTLGGMLSLGGLLGKFNPTKQSSIPGTAGGMGGGSPASLLSSATD